MTCSTRRKFGWEIADFYNKRVANILVNSAGNTITMNEKFLNYVVNCLKTICQTYRVNQDEGPEVLKSSQN